MKKNLMATLIVVSLIFGGCGDKSDGEYYSHGQFRVGVDMPAGEYIAVGRGDITLRDSDKQNADSLIANSFIENRQYIDVRDGEYLSIGGVDLKVYPSARAPKIGVSGKLSPAQYKVGTDIPAGEYKITGSYQVAETTRLKWLDEGVARSFSEGEKLVTVFDGQYLKIGSGEGELVRSADKVVESQVSRVNLGMTVEQFKKQYASAINATAPTSDFDVSKMTLTQVENQDGFLFKLANNVEMFGLTKNVTGELLEVTIISKPETAEDAGAALLAFALVVEVLSPELTVNERGELFAELNLRADAITKLKRHGVPVARGNVKYSASYDAVTNTFYFSART